MSFSEDVAQFSARSIFKRCVLCPPTSLSCPTCAKDEACTMVAQSCTRCAAMTCTKVNPVGSGSSDSKPKGGTNGGAIAGGVIGGLAVVGIVAFLIWWFVIRKKRRAEAGYEKEDAANTANRQAMHARRSVASIASTVLTRASNVIQIAYIPGVTNRSPPDTPGTLVPPVPPLPGASADQHFFMPGDLRGSAWSGMTEEDRRSIAPSLARSSVATTIYRSNAIVSPIPAQQALRTKAAMVSVKSGLNTPSQTPPRTPRTGPADAPAVPAITTAQLSKAGVIDTSNSSIVARTVTARPVNVKKSAPTKVATASDFPATPSSNSEGVTRSESQPDLAAPRFRTQFDNDSSTFDSSSEDEDLDERPPKSVARRSAAAVDGSPRSPFADTQAAQVDSGSAPALNTGVSSSRNSVDGKGSTHRQRSSLGSTRLLEEALANAARDPLKTRRNSTHSTASSRRGPSPFSDANEVKSS